MKLHGNARTCVHGRLLIVERVLEQGWTLTAAGEAAGVSVRTVSKWLARFRAEGVDGLLDRSSVPGSVYYVGPWGTHRITIHPFSTIETFGRGGFFIHGGATPGSAGCIDLWTHMASFARELRSRTPEGHKVKLTVEYDHERLPESWD